MSLSTNITNCKIEIKDVDLMLLLAESTILDYDERNNRIAVPQDCVPVEEGMVINACIHSTSGLFETHGKVGALEDGRRWIMLYEGSEFNDRQALRYQVSIDGEVESIQRMPEGKIDESFAVTVRNMSSIGLLLIAPQDKIKQGDIVRFSAVSKGQRLIITVVAKRVELEEGQDKIGCSVQMVNLG